MNRRWIQLGTRGLLAYGHWGRPLIAFPSQQGHAGQYEERGMIDALAGLIDAGRLKVYCVDSLDTWTWHDQGLPLEERARRHTEYENWMVNSVSPWICDDAGGQTESMVTGVSFGAYHAANFALKRADLFPLAICQSGVYDVSVVGWGERGEAVYFNNPLDYVSHLHGEHLDWLRGHVNLLLICGQGAWEDTTGALEGTKHFAHLLREKGLNVELDLWGHDVIHDWPSWRDQVAHHLPRFC